MVYYVFWFVTIYYGFWLMMVPLTLFRCSYLSLINTYTKINLHALFLVILHGWYGYCSFWHFTIHPSLPFSLPFTLHDINLTTAFLDTDDDQVDRKISIIGNASNNKSKPLPQFLICHSIPRLSHCHSWTVGLYLKSHKITSLFFIYTHYLWLFCTVGMVVVLFDNLPFILHCHLHYTT